MADKSLPFPNFREALRANHEAANKLPPATFYRYAKGELPATFEWFLEFPDVLEGLVADARAMTDDDWENFRKAIRKRAKAAKARRKSSADQ